MVVLGASLLWFGWFGFNAGSALAASGLATSAFVVTNTAAAMAALTWMTVTWAHKGTPSVLGAAAGAVAGLVAITPASGFVTSGRRDPDRRSAPAVICYGAVQLRDRMKVDDALDVWAVHGIGGTWGAICHRPLRHHRDQRGRRQRPVLRQPRAARDPAPGGRGLVGLLRRGPS